ncbi:hypothetical protein [Altererythrobacter sp. Root672]|uniref:hypothetical protein n=1 Tax=Altererythrobacter sp. Root672 TaxID=1736584 RepID=UPI0012E38430|nr:hypothetical protein [Altererythrobacter sp. Root672]
MNLHLFFSFERIAALLRRAADVPHPSAAERASNGKRVDCHLQNQGDSSLLEYVAIAHQQCGIVAQQAFNTLFLDKAARLCQAARQS